MSSEWRRFYLNVISSQRWRFIKKRLIELRGNKCEGCGETGCQLDLHHDTYERLGRELESDLRLLCRDCHRAEDILRAERGEQRSSSAYDAACANARMTRVDRYMTRRYGEDWEYMYDPLEASEMYIESKEWRTS
jgi:hypothetical protein